MSESETPRTANWLEDAGHENGNYQCVCDDCGQIFVGHKRRHQCKLCFALAAALERAEKAERLAEYERNWAIKRDADYAAAQDRVDDLTRKLAEAETRLLFLQRLADKCGTVTVHGLDGADGLAAYQLESFYRGLLYPSLAEAIDAAIAKEPK